MSNNPYEPTGSPSPGGFSIDPKGPTGPKPKNYLVESILLLVCCAGPLAIPAIVFAAQVDSKYNSGDHMGAKGASDNAKMWCIIALCGGLACNVIVGILQVLAIAVAEA